ncbi:MAG: hypothetical protein H7A45_20985 [Verrucomicrobiales bacterium]|nr:hypothetical protein [Verrucomicrobiales bacterium]
MKFAPSRINLYLAMLLLAAAAGGCASEEERRQKKEASSLRLYLEQEFDRGDQTTVVPVYRADPSLVRIDKNYFLDEGHLTRAEVVDVVGGFAIAVQFDFHGTLVLENVSNSYRGRRVAIYCLFTDGRWLAAPRLGQRITDGKLVFTPDATREEAERLVRGLNNVAVQLGNQPKPGKQKQAEDSF